MPVRRPVPIKVPIVSNVSERLKEKIVTNTSGIFDASENREPKPSLVKIAPKVVGSCWHASVKLMVSVVVVTPIGIPSKAVTTMPIRMAPLTLHTSRTIVNARPIRNSQKDGWFKVANAGTPESKVIIPTFNKPI